MPDITDSSPVSDVEFINIIANNLGEPKEAVETAFESVGRNFLAIRQFLLNDRGVGNGSCFDRHPVA